jgi:hypothetical protein
MIKLALIFTCIFSLAITSFAKTGDTTHVPVVDKHLWNVGQPSQIDNWVIFPAAGKHYSKVLLRYKLTCPSPSCGQWDYTTKVILNHHTGVIDSVLKDAPSFTVGTSAVDSFAFRHDTTRTYSYNSSKKTTDSSANGVTKIYFYKNPVQPFQATDSVLVWQAGYWNYRYDNTGKKIDSFYVKPDSILHVTTVKAQYHFEVIVPYEIARYITPYGQGFAPNWYFTWTMDVTDYAFLLHDSCEFISTYDGWSQGSLYSLSFDMVEGTPGRETYRVDVLHDGYFPWGNTSDPISNYVKPKNIWVDPNADLITFRTFTTGHGNVGPQAAAEFTDETHSIWVNGVKKYDQHLWRDDCGRNPAYPQTGTYTLSRAGWCPGDKVDPWDFDLTGMGKAGDSINIDYRFADDPGNAGGGYAVHTQAIYSKGPQFDDDAELLSIEAPTNEPTYRRTNPICSQMTPIIKIRNNGKKDLTALTILYHIDDSTAHTYSWTGLLKFYQVAEIALPGIDLGTGTHTFYVALQEPNTGYDLTPNDDSGSVTYTMPKIYSNKIFLSLLTDFLDGPPNGISYDVVDVNDNILYSQSNLSDKTTIRDTFKLATGCYRFRIYDSSDYHQGLYPWLAYQGIPDHNITFGSYTLKDDKKATIWNANTANGLAGFSPIEIVPFMVQAPAAVHSNGNSTIVLNNFSLYPNPAHGKISLDLSNISEYSGELRVSVFSLLGKEIITRTIFSGEAHLDLDMHYYPAGTYIIRLQYGNVKVSKQCVME